MTRQFAGLPMTRQLAYATEYRDRFSARVVLGNVADPIRVTHVPSARNLSLTDAEALEELDSRCHAEWRAALGLHG